MESSTSVARPTMVGAPPASRWAPRAAVAIMLAGVAALAWFSLSVQHAVVEEAQRADRANRLATAYQDTRFWVGQEESLERKYRLEPTAEALLHHEQARNNVNVDLMRVAAIDRSHASQLAVSRLLRDNADYVQATRRMFAAVRAGRKHLVAYYDHTLTDPVFGALQTVVYLRASTASADALTQSTLLRKEESRAFWAGVLAIVVGIVLVGSLGLVIRRSRRAIRRTRAGEFERLAQLAITDPLTGVRNHRAFHEDLIGELERVGRTGVPLALVMVDLDGLKAINDAHGHLAGDVQLRALADALIKTGRAGDRAYRIGGDEFAVILPGSGEWSGFRFAQRVCSALAEADGLPVSASAGVAQALMRRPKHDLIHEADTALINAKRSLKDVVVYTAEMEQLAPPSALDESEEHARTLASALALAVDVKDSHTRSHCQTVSTLCALVAAELGLDPDALRRIRLAGLLHDVGKIGIPDAILQKPSKLDAAEFELMKTHSQLGEGIVLAAEMPREAGWVRHHHERIDGGGYPDGLAGDAIPLEARIIHVVDAFEAMTSDRPYRKAPGEEFALAELARHAGTQFDADVVQALVNVIGVCPVRALQNADTELLAAAGA